MPPAEVFVVRNTLSMVSSMVRMIPIKDSVNPFFPAVRLWCAFYSILLVLYVLSYVSERNVAPQNMLSKVTQNEALA
jgi:hypothetical protein